MLSSITPLGERSRNQRYAVAVAWYVLGSIAGGATLGLLFGSLGDALETMFGSPPVAAQSPHSPHATRAHVLSK